MEKLHLKSMMMINVSELSPCQPKQQKKLLEWNRSCGVLKCVTERCKIQTDTMRQDSKCYDNLLEY